MKLTYHAETIDGKVIQFKHHGVAYQPSVILDWIRNDEIFAGPYTWKRAAETTPFRFKIIQWDDVERHEYRRYEMDAQGNVKRIDHKIPRREAEAIAARINAWIEAEKNRAEDENDVTKFEAANCQVGDDGLTYRDWDIASYLEVNLYLWSSHTAEQESANYWIMDEVRKMMGDWGEELEDCSDHTYTAIIEIEDEERKEVAQ